MILQFWGVTLSSRTNSVVTENSNSNQFNKKNWLTEASQKNTGLDLRIGGREGRTKAVVSGTGDLMITEISVAQFFILNPCFCFFTHLFYLGRFFHKVGDMATAAQALQLQWTNRFFLLLFIGQCQGRLWMARSWSCVHGGDGKAC